MVCWRGLPWLGSTAPECRPRTCGLVVSFVHVRSPFPDLDQTRGPCVGRQILHHWTSRDVSLSLSRSLASPEEMVLKAPWT